jgi:tetratricopeptide (TPR) repeat protein
MSITGKVASSRGGARCARPTLRLLRTPYVAILSWTVFVTLATPAAAADRVRMTSGITQSGRVVEMDPASVSLDQGSGAGMKNIPANEIEFIHFEDEPLDLRNAKGKVLLGQWADALAMLNRIKNEPTRFETQQDLQFYKALCGAKLALAGKRDVPEAGRLMRAFADVNSGSFHYYQAAETIGDLLAAIGQFGAAAGYYERLRAAPWADYKMRAGVAGGGMLLAQGKAKEALAAFDEVIANDAEGDAAEQQRAAARLAKARALAALKKPDDAIRLIDEIIKGADASNDSDAAKTRLLARAYTALGTAQRAAGRTTEAILAFLRVDQLYSTEPDAHAESLANLAELWTERRMIERARKARQTLRERYKDSPWARKIAKEFPEDVPPADAKEPEKAEEEE